VRALSAKQTNGTDLKQRRTVNRWRQIGQISSMALALFAYFSFPSLHLRGVRTFGRRCTESSLPGSYGIVRNCDGTNAVDGFDLNVDNAKKCP
jgi:hypothetical protein